MIDDDDEKKDDAPDALDDEDEHPNIDSLDELEVNTDNLVSLSGSAIVTPEVIESDDVIEIFDRIRQISHHVVHDGYLELGRLFFRVRRDALYLRRLNPVTPGKAYAKWEDYVDVESDFSVRSINYMMAIWWWFSALKNFPTIREMIREVGWKKTRALVGVVDDKNYEAWFEKAKTLPFTDLYKLTSVAMSKAGIDRRPAPAATGAFRPDPKGVEPEESVPTTSQSPAVQPIAGGVDVRPLVAGEGAEVVDGGSGEVPLVAGDRGGLPTPTPVDVKTYEEQLRLWSTRMTGAQIEHVERAVAAVWDVLLNANELADRRSVEEVGRGLAIEMMATHLLTFYGGAANQVKELRGRAFLAEMVKAFEKNYGVDLIVLDRKKGDIIYGLGEEVLEATEKKLDLELIAFRKGTNKCVYGWDKAQSLDEIQSDPDETKEKPQ